MIINDENVGVNEASYNVGSDAHIILCSGNFQEKSSYASVFITV